MLFRTENLPARPEFMDPEAIQATLRYLTNAEAHLRDGNANTAPSPVTLLPHSAYGCIAYVALVADPETPEDVLMAVSIDGEAPDFLDVPDYLALRVGTALGLRITEEMVSHGMERSAFFAAALASFDQNAGRYEFDLPREQFLDMLNLAFGLIDVHYGTDADGLFPVTILTSAEGSL